jgi:hypothetical protein
MSTEQEIEDLRSDVRHLQDHLGELAKALGDFAAAVEVAKGERPIAQIRDLADHLAYAARQVGAAYG